MLSFHSLRSGFICSAIITAGSNKEQLRAILEDCAMIAGWVPNQKAQMRYVKDSQIRTLVATRVVTQEGKHMRTKI
jgi:hypothetical protein